MNKIAHNSEFMWAIDLSLKNTGVAIFNQSKIPVFLFSIPTEKLGTDIQFRLKAIGKTLEKYKTEYPCGTLVVENGFARFIKATQQLYRVRGVIEYVFADSYQFGYSPRTIKKIITGDSKATKEKVQDAVLKIYPFLRFDDFDQSDAVAIGLTHYKVKEDKEDE